MKNPNEKIFEIATEFYNASEGFESELEREFAVRCMHGMDQVMFSCRSINILIDGGRKSITLPGNLFLDPLAMLEEIGRLEILLKEFKDKRPELRKRQIANKKRELLELEMA